MPFRYDTTGVKEAGGFSPAPKGTYILKIVKAEEGMSRKNLPQVKVELEIAEGSCRGKKVWHNVTFLPPDQPGAGFSKAWLKHIGQAFEGKVLVAPANWVNRKIEADLDIESYEGKDGTMKQKNVIVEHRKYDGQSSQQEQPNTQEQNDDEAPF